MTAPVTLVTGGSRGIGRAIVETLAAEGKRVAFTWKSGEDAAREVETATRGRARAFHYDLADRDRPQSLAGEIQATFGPLEGLVNNAGFERSRLLAMTSDALWDEVLDGNLSGAFRCCRAVVPHLVRRRGGSIVNIASLSATHGVAGHSAYSAAKAGLLGMTRSLAREIGKRNVRVNAVVAGFVSTEMTEALPPERVRDLRAGETLPLGTDAAAVARTVSFLLSDAASAVTGQSLVVDSGCTA